MFNIALINRRLRSLYPQPFNCLYADANSIEPDLALRIRTLSSDNVFASCYKYNRRYPFGHRHLGLVHRQMSRPPLHRFPIWFSILRCIVHCWPLFESRPSEWTRACCDGVDVRLLCSCPSKWNRISGSENETICCLRLWKLTKISRKNRRMLSKIVENVEQTI